MANQKQINQDNNEILERVMETLEYALSNNRKDGEYEFIVHDENGSHVVKGTKEEYTKFMIEYAIEKLGEHSYFYEKEGIDKYEGETN
ncbi:MAG TPA: hypothetical protein VEY70_19630 [Metabacillus sp.]|nr:hypothetical protein [Metabacillus sp.]